MYFRQFLSVIGYIVTRIYTMVRYLKRLKSSRLGRRGVGQASRAHIFAESVAQNPYIFRIAGLRVYRPAGTAGVNLNKVRR